MRRAALSLAGALAVGLAAVLPGAVFAQELQECDWQVSAQNIPEPWGDHSRSFADGAVRLAVLDTIEPGGAPLRLLVLSPPHDEIDARQCKVVGLGGAGFAGMAFDRLEADYDPALGLTFVLPVQLHDAATGGFAWPDLSVTVNQATGAITPSIEN